MIKKRSEVAKFINDQVSAINVPEKHGAFHYGMVELRQLMDYLYDGPPESEDELIKQSEQKYGILKS